MKNYVFLRNWKFTLLIDDDDHLINLSHYNYLFIICVIITLVLGPFNNNVK